MPTTTLYYIDSSNFNTATSVYSDVALTIKAPDGYYSFSGVYRRQLFGDLKEVITCTGLPVAVDCVVSAWSDWSVCMEGVQTRTRTVITPASNGGATCPVLEETQSCSVPPDITNPTVPGGLNVISSTSTSVFLGWTNSTDNVAVDYYEIHRKTDIGGSYSLIGTMIYPGNTYNDTGLATLHDYYYKVRAVDISGNFSGFSNEVVEPL
jgi:hypothetical protein